MPGLQSAEIAVISPVNSRLAEQLVASLLQHNYAAAAYQSPPATAKVVISLLAYQHFAAIEQAIAANFANFSLANQLAARFQEQGGSLVILQDTGGQFALQGCPPLQAWAAGGSGLIKTAAHEWPQATVKIIDLAGDQLSENVIANKIVNELINGGPEVEIALSKEGGRYTLEVIEDQDFGLQQTDFSPSAVYLVSGGARGVTAACIKQLALHSKARFALLGRTALSPEPVELQSAVSEAELKAALIAMAKRQNTAIVLPEIQKAASLILANREVRETLEQIAASGAQAIYYACDVQDPVQLAATIEKIHQQWGPITGLIHGAGVLADKLIKDKTAAQFNWVFDTKVKGLQALLAATAKEPLQIIALFSSVAGRFGNAGQADYAMANEVLNKVAQVEQIRRGAGCVVKSLNWGPWEAGMVSPALKEHFRQQHINLLPMAVGVDLFVEELRHRAAGQVELVLGSSLPKAENTAAQAQEFCLSATTHSYLVDHTVKNAPVVPICLVLEWLLRSARQLYPQLALTTCENVRVLKPLRLENFAAGHSFKMEAVAEKDKLIMNLRSQHEVLHYSAVIPLTPLARAPMLMPEINATQQWPWTAAEVYQRQLIFHGPAFQVVHSLEQLADEDASGSVLGISAMSRINRQWLEDKWLIDVAALDGGLQIAWLFSYCKVAAGLPMAIKRFTVYELGLITEPVKVRVHRQQHNQFTAVFNLQYQLANGKLLAEIEGLEEVYMVGGVL